MRARVRITDLSAPQWARLQDRLMTSYHITAGAARVCAEFESGHPQDEVRHVEMPVQEFATVMTELAAMAPIMNTVVLSPRVTPATTWGPGLPYIPGQGYGAGWND
jgi:hypothetical protein